jgi:gluconolactonase
VAASDYEILDERFDAIVRAHERLHRLFDDCRWAEGPVYLPASRSLVWSDIPEDRLLRWDETTGAVGVLRRPARYPNGNTVDREGRLVTCEHGERRVTRTEPSGRITVLADRVDGRRLNSPNDVVVRSDGSVWFSDPTYGIDSDYEGHRGESETAGSHVYRIDPVDGRCRRVADDFVQPNGLAFSLDERRLYVADTGESHVPDGPRHIRVFDVSDDGRLSGGDVLATCTAGVFDGIRLDEDGRIWAAAGDGVPETVANVAFGGPRRSRLFICASSSVWALHLAVLGAPGALQL